MNKQRLLELAGISSNMSNPSQEPYTEIPSSAEEPNDLGSSGERTLLDKIGEIASRGAEKGHEECQEILDLIDSDQGGEDEGRGEELEPDTTAS